MKELFEPPAELFEQLSKDLKAEAHAIEQEPHISERAKLRRYLKKLGEFAAGWLERIAPPRDQTARRQSRQIFQATIPRIVKAITAREALRAINLPGGGVGAIVHEAGQMKPAEPEYPDRPFPETPKKLAQWENEIARLQRLEAARAKAAEEIQSRPYGIFERAMAPDWLQEAISFRSSIGWMEEQLRRHLMWKMEKLLLNYALRIPEAEALPEQAPTVQSAPSELEIPAKGSVGMAAQEEDVNAMIEAARHSADPKSAFEELRKRAKWERKALAEATGLSQPTISRIFQGKGNKDSRKKFSQALAKRLAVLADSH